MALLHPDSLAEMAAFVVPALGSFARRGLASNRRGIGDRQVAGSGPAGLIVLDGAGFITVDGSGFISLS